MNIYEELKLFANKNPGKVYDSQDFNNDGKKETEYVFWGKEPSKQWVDEKAHKYVQKLSEMLNSDTFLEEKVPSLIDSELIRIYFSLSKYLDLYINEKLINKSKLFLIGEHLIKNSSKSVEVKLGLIFTGRSQKPEAKELAEIMALHSKFTFYAAVSARDIKKYNTFLFELAKKVSGYGKLHCLQNIEPMSDEIKDWLIEQGGINTVNQGLTTLLAVSKVSIAEYMNRKGLGAKEFSALSRDIYYMLSFEDKDIHKIKDSCFIVNTYLDLASKYAATIYDLAAIVYIQKAVKFDWNEGKSGDSRAGWDNESEWAVRDRCSKVLNAIDKLKIFKDSLDDSTIESNHLYSIAHEIGYNFTFEDHKKLLDRDKYDYAVYSRIYVDKNYDLYENLVDYAKDNLDFEGVCNKDYSISEGDLKIDNKVDICLLYVLKCINELKNISPELPLKALFSRFDECRIEAIEYFKQHKLLLTKTEVKELLNKAFEREDDEKIKSKISKLLGGTSTSLYKKEIKHVDVERLRVKQNIRDIFLFSTHVAGMMYMDIEHVESMLKIGAQVCLKREKDNIHDENAVLVTTESGFALGYLPKGINILPSRLMDGSKILYGIINDFELDSSKMSIDVYYSYKDVVDAVNDAAKLISKPTSARIN